MSNKERLTRIRRFRLEIKRLLKKGEAVYIEDKPIRNSWKIIR